MNYLAVSSQRVKKSERRNVCKPSKERVETCKEYIISREITTVLKIAVDNPILKL